MVQVWGYKELVLENSVFVYDGDVKEAPYRSAISLISPDAEVSEHRVENVKVLARDGVSYSGLMLTVLVPWRPDQKLLISGNEFSEGVTVPLENYIPENCTNCRNFDVSENSEGNIWLHPVGDIAATGCSGSLGSGSVGFQGGIRCNAWSPAVSTTRPSAPVPAQNAIHSALGYQPQSELIHDSIEFDDRPSPIYTASSAVRSAVGYGLFIVPMLGMMLH